MRYFVNYRHSDTGLTPTFTYFKKASDLTNQTAPTPIVEVGNGRYYFDHTPTYDEIWELDGGASIPTEEIRYVSGSCSPNDDFVTVITAAISAGTTAVNAHTDAETAIVTALIGTAVDVAGTGTLFGHIASVSTDTAGIATANAGITNIATLVTRALGMLHENSFLDLTSFDVNNNFTGGRLRIFDTKAHASAALPGDVPSVGVNGLIAYYTITASYTGVNLTTYKVTREAP